MVMKYIEYINGNEDLLDSISPLWKKLNDLHVQESLHFKEFFRRRIFTNRKEELLKKLVDAKMRIDMALLKSARQMVGYCVSTLSGNGRGEIDSLFVEKSYRNQGVGSTLIKNALLWMTNEGAISKHVVLTPENKAALKLYDRFGFVLHLIELQQKSR
jgi:ribosomal protein S18 acetylase RimI-like enzyme